MKVPLGDKEVDAERVEFQMESDPWQALVIPADGTRLRLKPVVMDVFRTAEKTPEGSPIFVLKAQIVVVSEKPEEPSVTPSGGAKQ